MVDSQSSLPDTLGSGLRAARALGESRNYRGAIDVLRRLLGRHPDNVEAHYLLGLYLNNIGEHAGAVAECRAAVALAPTDAVAHRLLGIALGANGLNKAEGLEHLRQAVTLAPTDGFNHFFLARALVGLARPADALASFIDACERAPSEALVLGGTAEFLFTVHQVRKARDLASRALAADPQDLTALTAQAKSRLIDGRAADARDLARAAVALHATHRPAVEVLVEAEMCRNPVFTVWSRLKNWRLGGKWRAPILAIGASLVLVGALFIVATQFPMWSMGGPVVLAVWWILGALPKEVYRRRIEAAFKPVTLRKTF